LCNKGDAKELKNLKKGVWTANSWEKSQIPHAFKERLRDGSFVQGKKGIMTMVRRRCGTSLGKGKRWNPFTGEGKWGGIPLVCTKI